MHITSVLEELQNVPWVGGFNHFSISQLLMQSILMNKKRSVHNTYNIQHIIKL